MRDNWAEPIPFGKINPNFLSFAIFDFSPQSSSLLKFFELKLTLRRLLVCFGITDSSDLNSEVSVGYQVRRVMVILESRHHIPINQLTQKTKNNDNYHEKCLGLIKVMVDFRSFSEWKKIKKVSFDINQTLHFFQFDW